MIYRYNVHFEINEDVEVSVLISTKQTDKEIIIDYAEKKLEELDLFIIKDHYKKVNIDLLETLY